MPGHNAAYKLYQSPMRTADPGNGGTISSDRNPQYVSLVSAGAETRTLARPTRENERITLYARTVGGTITVTVTGGYNTAGTTTYAFTAAGQWAMFESFFDGTNYFWRLTDDFTAGSAGAGIGYPAGTGGTVTQATSRTTGVTLNKLTGQITTNNASLAAEAAAEFTVTNSLVGATDTVVLSIASGSNGGDTEVIVSAVAAGSFNIKVCNNNASGGTAETGAIVINFAVLKGAAS